MTEKTVEFRGVKYDTTTIATLATQGRLEANIPTDKVTYVKGADTSKPVMIGVANGDGTYSVLVGQLKATNTQTLRVLSKFVLKKAVARNPNEIQWARQGYTLIDTRFDSQSPNRHREDPQAGLLNPIRIRI